ncbi:MAG: hypothetical protein AB1896_15215 [Thermodesulfobacteriota bacterium]
MKKLLLVLVVLLMFAAAPVLAWADDQAGSPEQYRIQAWRGVWEAPSYWDDVWSPGWFRWHTWVERRHPGRYHKYNAWRYWKSRYYVNYRLMQNQAYDQNQEMWVTTPETEWPADRGYVFPATYGRTFLRNIRDIWEIKTN